MAYLSLGYMLDHLADAELFELLPFLTSASRSIGESASSRL
jgi:hypothetical protein